MMRQHPVTESVTIDDQLLVTPEEAARRLSIGRTTVYELMASGEPPVGQYRPLQACAGDLAFVVRRQVDRRRHR